MIIQVFTTIELFSGDSTSCCWTAKEFGSGGAIPLLTDERSNFGEGTRMPIVSTRL